MNDSIPFYINHLMDAISSPWGILALVLGVALAVALANVPALRWGILAVLIYTTTFGILLGPTGAAPALAADRASAHLAFPLDIIQGNARSFSVICLVFLLIPTVMFGKGQRIRLLSGAMVAFFAFQIWMSLRLMLDFADPMRAVLEFVVFGLTFLSLGVGLSRWLQGPKDARSLVKSFAGFGMLFVLGNIYQLLMTPALMHEARFAGTTTNPQFVGMSTAIALPACLFLVLDKAASKAWRFASLLTAGFLVIFLLWSGSRTGLLMALLGVLLLFGVRLHRAILPALGLALVLWVAPLLFPNVFVSLSDAATRGNDRAQAWSAMFDTFLANPLIGASFAGQGYAECAFLAALAFYGIVGGIPMLLSALLTITGLGSVVRHKQALGSASPIANFLLAEFAMIATCGMLECTLLGAVSLLSTSIYLAFALLAFAKDQVRMQAQHTAVELAGYQPSAGFEPDIAAGWFIS